MNWKHEQTKRDRCKKCNHWRGHDQYNGLCHQCMKNAAWESSEAQRLAVHIARRRALA